MDRPEAWDATETVPTPKEMAVVKRFADTGYDLSRIKECAAAEGASNALARRAVAKIANNPRLQKALKRQGITYSRLAKKLDELLDAKHPQYPERNDNIAQGKALEFAARVMDALPSQKIELDRTETHVLVLAPETLAAIQRVKGVPVIDAESEPVKGYFE